MFLYIFSGVFLLLAVFGLGIMIRTLIDLFVLSVEKRKAKKSELERLRNENCRLREKLNNKEN